MTKLIYAVRQSNARQARLGYVETAEDYRSCKSVILLNAARTEDLIASGKVT